VFRESRVQRVLKDQKDCQVSRACRVNKESKESKVQLENKVSKEFGVKQGLLEIMEKTELME
jgi:hypothetical protein